MSDIWGDNTIEADDADKVEILRPLADGIHRDIPFERYVALDRVSKTLLQTVYTRSPAHALVAKEESNLMKIGTAVHCAVLEPDEFRARFHRGPEDKRGNRWKAVVAEYGDGALTDAEYDNALALRDAIRHNPYVKKLTGHGAYREITACSTDPETGLLCRMRADAHVPGDGILCDLKTTNDARAFAFRKTVRNFGYHLQEAHYSKTWADAGGDSAAFLFVVVEPEPPYAVKIYELDADTIAEGEAIRAKSMRIVEECMRTGEWPLSSGEGWASEFKVYSAEPEVIGIGKYDYQETVPLGSVE